MRPLNVLFVIDSLAQRGGTELQLLELVSRVDPARFRIHVCCFEENSPPLQLPAPHVLAIFPLIKVNSVAGVRQLLRLRSYIQRNRIDLVQTYMFKATVLGVLAARHTCCRAIVTTRRDMEDLLAPRHIRMMRFLNGRTTRILANAEAVKARVAELEGASPRKIDVLHNGVDLQRFRCVGSHPGALTRLGIPEGAPVVGIVANLRPVKDIPLFLAAAREVAAAVPGAVFLVIGRGTLRAQLETLAGQLGIRETVFFLDDVSDIAGYLHAMKVACLSSLAEGFSNAILEYMAAGLPVVATAAGGNAEAIVDSVTGYVVESRGAAEFAAPIIRLLRDEENRRAMGQRALVRCRERFDILAVVRRQEDYWNALVGER